MDRPIVRDAIKAIGGVREVFERVDDQLKRDWFRACAEIFERTVEQILTDRCSEIMAARKRPPHGEIRDALERIVSLDGELLVVRERGRISSRTNLEIRSAADLAMRIEDILDIHKTMKEFDERCMETARADSGIGSES